MAERWPRVGAAFVNFGWEVLDREPELSSKECDLIVGSLQIIMLRVGEKEVEQDQARSDEFKRVFAPVTEARFADRLVERAAKEMADGSPTHVIANRGVSVIEHLLGEKVRTFALAGLNKC